MEIVYYFLTISSVTAAIIWIGKLVITKTFDAGIEKYKSELTKEIEERKSELAKDIEEHKAELSKLHLEYQVKFSKLHEQRAEVIKSLFSKIIDLEGSLINCTSLAQGAEYMYDVERDKEAKDKIIDLISQFEYNKIYFSNLIVPKFEAIFKESWDIVSQMAKVRRDGAEVAKYVEQHQPIPETYLRFDDLWDKAFYRATGEFRSLKEDLANEFRSLLGIA